MAIMTENLFNEIYGEYHERIFRYCYNKLNDLKDTEDCVQDTFYALYISTTIKDYNNIQWWLYAVADRHIYRIWTMRKRIDLDDQADNQQNKKFFEDGFDELQLKLLLIDIERYLSSEEKQLFVLLYQEDKSISDIAGFLQVTESAVYKHKNRLDKKLRIIIAGLES